MWLQSACVCARAALQIWCGVYRSVCRQIKRMPTDALNFLVLAPVSGPSLTGIGSGTRRMKQNRSLSCGCVCVRYSVCSCIVYAYTALQQRSLWPGHQSQLEKLL